MDSTKTEIELDLTPDTHMLIGCGVTPLGWKKCLAEIVDNAFDANADSVVIEYAKKTLRVTDNGSGCSDINAFFRMGAHRSKGGLGKYGVGLKDAAHWLWGTTQVATVQSGRMYSASVAWEQIARASSWKLKGYEAPAAGKENGTELLFSNIRHPLQNKEAIISELGYRFAPGIESGRHIVFKHNGKRHPVEAWRLPPLEHIVDAVGEVSGKQFRVMAGVVQTGQKNEYPGFSIAYKHRICVTTRDGCGNYGTARFCGIVYLGEGWQLSRNKDEIITDAEGLAAQLYFLCHDTLAAADQQSTSVELAGLEQQIGEALQDAIATEVKSKRKKTKEEKGTKEPKESERRQRKAGEHQPGDKRLLTRVGSGIRVQFVDGLPDIGKAEFNDTGTLISLSNDEPYVQWAKLHRDKDTLVALAAAVLAVEVSCTEQDKVRHRLLPEMDDDGIRVRFLKALSLYTKRVGAAVVVEEEAAS